MFGWLKAKAQKASVDAMRDDLVRFVRGLQGASSAELGDALVMATLVRLKIEGTGEVPHRVFSLSGYSGSLEDDMVALKINRLIRGFQKDGQTELAAGAMVWLHTVRAIQNPELRLVGRQMWRELRRGVDGLDGEHILEGIRIGHFPQDMFEELAFLPQGLEPDIA